MKDWGESYTAEENKELDRYYEALSKRFRADGVSSEMSNAAIRKKDELRADDIQVHALVYSLEKRGLARNGVLLSYDKLLEKIQVDTPNYPYSKGVVDQILLLVVNTMLGNTGQSELYELPEEMRFEAAPGSPRQRRRSRRKRSRRGWGWGGWGGRKG